VFDDVCLIVIGDSYYSSLYSVRCIVYVLTSLKYEQLCLQFVNWVYTYCDRKYKD